MKNLITLIILAIFLFIDCQAQPRWYGDEVFYPHMTSLGSTSWIMVNDDGQTKVISGTALASYLGAGSTLLSANNPWTGINTHTKALGLASLASSTVNNSIFINSANGRLAVNTSAGLQNLATLDDLIPYDLGSTDDFFLKSASNTVTGSTTLGETFWSYGSNVVPPQMASAPVLGGLRLKIDPSDATKIVYSTTTKSGVEEIFLTREKAATLYGASGSNWNTTTDQYGLLGIKTITGGGIKYDGVDNSVQEVPVRTSAPASGHGWFIDSDAPGGYEMKYYISGVEHSVGSPTSVTAEIAAAVKNRKLDPIVFATAYPQAGEILGPFRMSMNLEITSTYAYVDALSGETVTFNVFFGTTVDKNAVAGTGPSTCVYYNNIVATPTNGVLVNESYYSGFDYYDVVPDEGDWVWCKIVSVSGSPKKFSITLNKKER